MEAEAGEGAGFGLYLHWPFCQAKCPYCDFNSHVSSRIDQSRWKSAYLSEIARVGADTPGRVLSTIYFGGGTPSLMDPDLVASVIDAVRSTWPMVNDPEITLEANPTSVEAGRLAGYRDSGVNRVSMGLQALDDVDLRRLGRLHSVSEAEAAFDIARKTFPRVSFDLIYARQDQSLSAWEAELRQALTMAADHLSLYQLTIEAGTAFGDRFVRGGLKGLPDEDLGADMFELTQRVCEEAGMPAYEISNHAAPGAESRHNLIYWQGGDYVGIGPGAHGRLTLGATRVATETHLAPAAWLGAVERSGSGDLPPTPLSSQDRLEEYALMGLRLRQGIAAAPLLDDAVLSSKIKVLAEDGLMEFAGSHLRLTDRGRPVLNAVLRKMFS